MKAETPTSAPALVPGQELAPASGPAASVQTTAPAEVALTAPRVRRSCACAGITKKLRSGTIWRGALPGPTLDELAHLLAPALLFSPDEPLLAKSNALAEPLPCDPKKGQATVYYQPLRLALRDEEQGFKLRPEEPLLPNVKAVVIRFFFYYTRDIGFDGHTHDLEVADFEVQLSKLGPSCYQLRLKIVRGLAHGVDWYNNVLEVTQDTKLPLTLFVEEGKHASAPDRNADGQYTPGYDVNVRINDAWGVRDVLGSSYLGGAGAYQAFMTKKRTSRSAILPPPQDKGCLMPAPWLVHELPVLGHYQLKPAWQVPQCRGFTEEKKLRGMFESHRFGKPPEISELGDLSAMMIPWSATTFWPSVSLRWDRRLGLAFAFRGLDLKELYLVPKVNVSFRRELSLEVLFTSTASQTLSKYLSVGGARERFDEELSWRFVLESGFKLRFRVPWWIRWLTIGHTFGGVRFGVRASGFNEFGHIRFIAEIGAGNW